MKKTLDDLIRLDVSFLNKKEKLREGRRVELAWFLRHKLVEHTHFYVQKDRLQFPHKEILFTETTCNYGGIRKWFRCPECSKRVRVLFGENFICRKCLKLNYKCQYETNSARMQRKLETFRETRPYLSKQDKPKFMHRKTFFGGKVRYARMEAEYSLMLLNE